MTNTPEKMNFDNVIYKIQEIKSKYSTKDCSRNKEEITNELIDPLWKNFIQEVRKKKKNAAMKIDKIEHLTTEELIANRKELMEETNQIRVELKAAIKTIFS